MLFSLKVSRTANLVKSLKHRIQKQTVQNLPSHRIKRFQLNGQVNKNNY